MDNNTLRRLNWLWKHRHKHDGENFQQQIQIIRQIVETQADEVAAGGSGAYIHLLSSGQTVTSSPSAISWTGMNSVLGLFEFATPSFPTTEVTVSKPGYYDVGVMVGFESVVSGAAMTVVRVRDDELTVFPPGVEAGIWTVGYQTKTFSDVAKGIEFGSGDRLKVYVSAGTSVDLAFATLDFELIDRFTGDPVDISPPLLLWLDASDLSSAGALSSWTDKSGSGNTVTQATGGSQPSVVLNELNGLPVVRFDGDNDNMKKAPLETTSGQPVTSFAVVRNTATTFPSVREIITCNPPGGTPRAVELGVMGESASMGDAGDWYAGNAAGTWITGPEADTGWHLLEAVFDGSSSRLLVDGTEVATGSVSTEGFAGDLTIGQIFDDGHQGDIAEIRVYQGALDATARSAIRDDLVAKWGL